MPVTPPPGEGIERLRAICRQLRAECPWDRAQTLETVQKLVGEEAAEISKAVSAGDWENLREEVGDTLFNLLLLATLAEEKGLFTWDAVCAKEAEKMVRRHPHVYGEAKASTPEEARAQFNRMKREERGA
ncbi:MAG: hypothetical protein L0216_04795 [Planctomycetales bacterium]|nr:hypothetical protein [Planctomycetales bacterium]